MPPTWTYLLALLLLAIPVLPAWSATWFISGSGADGGSCTETAPCQTFDHVRPRANAGDTIFFRTGSYPSIIISPQQPLQSGTSTTNRTRVAGYPGERVTTGVIEIRHNQGTPGLTRYVTIQNFVVQGFGVSGCNYLNQQPIDFNCGAHFIRFQDMESTNRSFQGAALGACGGSGYGSSNLEFINIDVHHCGVDNQQDPRPNAHGLYTCSPYTLYESIHSHHNAGYGMQNYESTSREGQDATGCGIGSIMRYSYFHDNSLLTFYGNLQMDDGDDLQVYNNVFGYTIGDNLAFIYSLNAGQMTNAQIYNNTIVSATGNGLKLGNPASGGSGTVMIRPIVRNNIVWLNAGSSQIVDTNVQNPSYSGNLCSSSGTGCASTTNAQFVKLDTLPRWIATLWQGGR